MIAVAPHREIGFRYVEQHGIAAYLADELEPSTDALRNDGYDVVVVRLSVRSLVITSGLVSSPCPS
ncbi:MAG: hypothetical protein H0X17_18355 [Deltaproteobacteria bacterium]|nr:hypothetical protein [Deltaproteobacteria bacterium]